MTDAERLARVCVCLDCGSKLLPKGDHLGCSACTCTYPLVCGIAVLTDDLSGAEQRKSEFLAERYGKLPYERLDEEFRSKPRSYWGPASHVPEHVRQRWDEYASRAHERGTEEFERCLGHLDRLGLEPPSSAGRGVEIGSGTGSGLMALSAYFEEVVALEPSLHAHILAKKHCEAKGVTGIGYVCGTAEKMPFPDEIFEFAVAITVIEHFADQPKGVAEIARTLKPSGVFFGNAPNRYDVFVPEQHVYVRFVGFVPRRWASTYTKLLGKIEYVGIRPPSYLELRRWLRDAFEDGRVDVRARVPRRTGKWAKVAPLIEAVNRIPLASQAFRLVAPNYDFVAVKAPKARDKSPA